MPPGRKSSEEAGRTRKVIIEEEGHSVAVDSVVNGFTLKLSIERDV